MPLPLEFIPVLNVLTVPGVAFTGAILFLLGVAFRLAMLESRSAVTSPDI
jgi:hypothetical protein